MSQQNENINLLFVDDCIHFSWLNILHIKSQAASNFKHFDAMVTRQFGVTSKLFKVMVVGSFKVVIHKGSLVLFCSTKWYN